MSDKIIFASEEKIGLVNNRKISYLSSQYLDQYNKARLEIKNKHMWKTSGEGAKFMGIYDKSQSFDPSQTNAKITGVTLLNDDKIIYSIHINEVSGLFIKNPFDAKEYEGHVLHKHNVIFNSVDFNNVNNKLVVSISEDRIESHLAILDVEDSNYRFITEGDSIDNNPSWSKIDHNAVYYDTAGIALNTSHGGVAVGPKFICKLDMDSGSIDEIISDEKYNYIKPKEDAQGNLYFIKMPYKEETKKGFSILHILLMPFIILKAIFGWLNFFSMIYAGKALTSQGANPTKQKEINPKQLFVEGNLINAEKSLNENKRLGEKYPGIAPRSWELMKMAPGSSPVTIKKGVIDYDINDQGEIIYSNGTFLVKLSEDEKEDLIGKAQLVSKVKFL